MTKPKKTADITMDEYADFLGRASKLYFIRDDNGNIINFIPNEGQMMLHRIIEEEFERSRSLRGVEQCRLIVLKPRQIGLSTYTAIRNLDFMLFKERCNGLVFAHEDDATERIYSLRYRIPFDELPDIIRIVDDKGVPIRNGGAEVNIAFKPETFSDSAFHLKFENQTKSDLWVRSAGGKLVKGGTINVLHLTEAADMAKYENLLRAVENELPLNAFNFAMIESTANGMTGDGEGFYKDWVNSVKEWERFQRGESDTFNGYRPVFLPWYLFSKHRMPLHLGKLIDVDHLFSTQEQRQTFYSREQSLVENKGVSMETINWYRYHLKEKLRGDFQAMNQYFPTIPEDAFLATDNCFFDSARLFDRKTAIESDHPGYSQGYLDEDITFQSSPTGSLRIWDMPDDSHLNRYVVSIDVSKGLAEGDYTCMYVFDRLKQRYVARWHGKIAEDLAAEEVNKLALFYNEALLVVEENMATVANLVKPGGHVAYSGPLFFREVRANGEPVWHFNTNPSSRKILLDNYKAWLRERYDTLQDIEETDEHLSFVRRVTHSGNVKFAADNGKKDDIVMSRALAQYGADWWEEPIATLTKDRNDISQIINVGHKPKRVVKLSSFGMPKTNIIETRRRT
jgi:hypothetical protein